VTVDFTLIVNISDFDLDGSVVGSSDEGEFLKLAFLFY
jgi:hypothetical protein